MTTGYVLCEAWGFLFDVSRLLVSLYEVAVHMRYSKLSLHCFNRPHMYGWKSGCSRVVVQHKWEACLLKEGAGLGRFPLVGKHVLTWCELSRIYFSMYSIRWALCTEKLVCTTSYVGSRARDHVCLRFKLFLRTVSRLFSWYSNHHALLKWRRPAEPAFMSL